MAKLIDERIERLGWELEGLNTEIEDRVADLKRELEHPTGMSNFAGGGGLLDILLAKRAVKQEELMALQRISVTGQRIDLHELHEDCPTFEEWVDDCEGHRERVQGCKRNASN